MKWDSQRGSPFSSVLSKIINVLCPQLDKIRGETPVPMWIINYLKYESNLNCPHVSTRCLACNPQICSRSHSSLPQLLRRHAARLRRFLSSPGTAAAFRARRKLRQNADEAERKGKTSGGVTVKFTRKVIFDQIWSR